MSKIEELIIGLSEGLDATKAEYMRGVVEYLAGKVKAALAMKLVFSLDNHQEAAKLKVILPIARRVIACVDRARLPETPAAFADALNSFLFSAPVVERLGADETPIDDEAKVLAALSDEFASIYTTP